MRNMKTIAMVTLIIVTHFAAFPSQSSFARQLGHSSNCPPLTQEETKRRYPSVHFQPGTVYIFGSVRRPGAFQYKEGLTLMGALKLAGGVLPDASLRVRILRVRVGEPEQPAIEADLEVIEKKQAADVVLENGYVIDVESRCAMPVPPVRQHYYDPVPKKHRSSVK